MIVLNNQQMKIVKLAGILLIIVFLVLAIFFGLRTKNPKSVELVFWSVFDDSDVYEKFFLDFQKKYPYITIKYYKKNPLSYEKELVDALAENRGPDIFTIHNTWLAKHKNKLTPIPVEMMTLKSYQDAFVDVAVSDFVDATGLIYAVPFYIDTLALYYNKDYLNTNGIAQPPKTWNDFVSDVRQLTIKDESNNIIRAGASIGTAKNINRSTDILNLLMLQNGVKMVNDRKNSVIFQSAQSGESDSPSMRVLDFYTAFANPQNDYYTWNTKLNYSIDMFYEGRSAMMFNYAYNIPTIKAKSPHLNFAVAKMPQISGARADVNYANYWAQAVSNKSKNVKYAWQFLLWMSGQDNLKKYSQITQKPVSRRDLVAWQRTDTEIGIFADQALTAQSWYQVDNSSIETIFAEMIELVVRGEATSRGSIVKAANQINVLMSR